jgi:thioredoxin-related protein
MAKTSFKDPKVAELFNANFINLKIEMEKDPDGREVAMKYSVKAYPTLLIIDSDGNLVKQTLGLQSAERLLDFGKSVL